MLHTKENKGFTLTELMMSVAILGTLTTIAVPNYFGQIERTKQRNMAASMEQILVRVVSFKEEIGVPPTSWKHLNDQSAIMTTSGPASDSGTELSENISLAGSDYSILRSNSNDDTNYYVFSAADSNNSKRNVLGCIDLITGASDVKLGIVDRTDQNSAEETDLNCR